MSAACRITAGLPTDQAFALEDKNDNDNDDNNNVNKRRRTQEDATALDALVAPLRDDMARPAAATVSELLCDAMVLAQAAEDVEARCTTAHSTISSEVTQLATEKRGLEDTVRKLSEELRQAQVQLESLPSVLDEANARLQVSPPLIR